MNKLNENNILISIVVYSKRLSLSKILTKLCKKIKLKINKKIESLNIANSASVVFFHINKAKKNLD